MNLKTTGNDRSPIVYPSLLAVVDFINRAFPGKVRSGFPSGMRTNKEIERFAIRRRAKML
ncbi:hypothetical protein [Rhizobium sp. AC27/96]|uniref:hypothetical protein n=1 Tax=Rhizobium sp. AC27/96 TaxID=1841653 RepID=UPI0011474602|nr:hypothetical protein [Rhizobium sp. AC27/96]